MIKPKNIINNIKNKYTIWKLKKEDEIKLKRNIFKHDCDLFNKKILIKKISKKISKTPVITEIEYSNQEEE